MTHTYLPFNVCKLGEHERPVEGQLCHVVVIQPRTEGLKREQMHKNRNLELYRRSLVQVARC